jgi:Arc/MetJ family transcription regulator
VGWTGAIGWYSPYMEQAKHTRRTNLVLDADQLEEARRILGTKTYSETVDKAIQETIRAFKIRQLPDLLRKVTWEGDLSEMREDRPRKRPAKRRIRR